MSSNVRFPLASDVSLSTKFDVELYAFTETFARGRRLTEARTLIEAKIRRIIIPTFRFFLSF